MNLLIVKELANYTKNKINYSRYGLFNGISGNCIFFHELSKSLKITDEYADDLLFKLFNSKDINLLKPYFGDGLSGIGWCIEYLLKNGFCKGNRDKVLEDIDIVVFKAISENNKIPFGISDGLIGYLIYILSRLEDNSNSDNSDNYLINVELFKTLINKIDREAPDYFSFITTDFKFNLLWTFPILFFLLSKSLKLNIYNTKIINMIKQWTSYIETLLPSLHSNRLYLAISLIKLNNLIKSPEIEKQINILLFSINFNKIIHECDAYSLNVNFSWMGQALIFKKASLMIDSRYPNYDKFAPVHRDIIKICKPGFEKNILDALNEVDEEKKPKVGLLNGLSGIGLMYLLYSDCFE